MLYQIDTEADRIIKREHDKCVKLYPKEMGYIAEPILKKNKKKKLI